MRGLLAAAAGGLAAINLPPIPDAYALLTVAATIVFAVWRMDDHFITRREFNREMQHLRELVKTGRDSSDDQDSER